MKFCWAKFYDELHWDVSTAYPISDSSEDQIPLILKSEFEHAIHTIKIGKSSGLDAIYSEYI